MTPRRRNLAMTILTLVIVALATAAFAWTQVKKQEEPAIGGIRVDPLVAPGCDCPRETAELSFTLPTAQPVSAAIVDEGGEPVRTLLEDAPRGSGRLKLEWDGTGDEGEAVPQGDYRLQVDLAEPDRTIVVPSDVRVRRPG